MVTRIPCKGNGTVKHRDRPPKTKRTFCPKRVMKTGEGPGSEHQRISSLTWRDWNVLEKHFSLAKESMRGKELRRDCENKSTNKQTIAAKSAKSGIYIHTAKCEMWNTWTCIWRHPTTRHRQKRYFQLRKPRLQGYIRLNIRRITYRKRSNKKETGDKKEEERKEIIEI